MSKTRDALGAIPPAPHPDEIREALLERARAYAVQNGGLKLSRVSKLAAGDGKFLPNVEAGGGFTLDRYAKVMAWFEQNWPLSPDVRRQKILDRAYEYMRHNRIRLSDVGRLARSDAAFFLRLEAGEIELTPRMHDQLIAWFEMNWPANHASPLGSSLLEAAE